MLCDFKNKVAFKFNKNFESTLQIRIVKSAFEILWKPKESHESLKICLN
jgi:hypothetical protein